MYSYSKEDTINIYKIIYNLIINKKNFEKNTLNSLQVQGKFIKRIRKNNSAVFSDDKSTFLFTSLMEKGSLTIEAAIVLPIILLGMIILIYFIMIINFQNILNQNMINTAWDICRYSYTAEQTELIVKKDRGSVDEQKNISEKLSDLSVSESLIKGGLTGAYALNKVLDTNVIKLAENLGIYTRLIGISMMESNFLEQENVDLAVSYVVKIPMISNSVYKMPFVNRCYFRNFIGESIDIKSKSFSKKVYITKNGTVYHINQNCTHIDLSVVSVAFSELHLLRNKGGGKYKKCDKCVKSKLRGNETVVITTNGDKYHTDNYCSGIIRNVITIDINQVGTRKLCKRCKEKEGT
ncbi:MAG: hypothetical protein HFI34_07110 [Lachnospiraceae bacterium]|nr:hypothetical protein [Lachnospiraceae bacterium]